MFAENGTTKLAEYGTADYVEKPIDPFARPKDGRVIISLVK